MSTRYGSTNVSKKNTLNQPYIFSQIHVIVNEGIQSFLHKWKNLFVKYDLVIIQLMLKRLGTTSKIQSIIGGSSSRFKKSDLGSDSIGPKSELTQPSLFCPLFFFP